MVDAADTETRKYKDYELTAIPYAGGWQVHIYPAREGAPKVSPDYANALDKEAAFDAAKRLIETRGSN
jgi:hypothetical protein